VANQPTAGPWGLVDRSGRLFSVSLPGSEAALVVIIVPTFNRARLVSRAIDSVLEQKDADVSVVVVDDGSTDGTEEALERYRLDARVAIVRHDRNRGVTAAKNTGLASLPVEAAWFGILDSDDILLPDAIRTMVASADGSGTRYSQVIAWCVDAESGAPTGQMTPGAETVQYEDALCGGFTGEFWHLARRDLLAERRFDERATGGEGGLWWLFLRDRPALLIPDIVRRYDRTGLDRVGVPRYTPQDAIGRMWAYRSVLDAVGADMLATCPRRYGTLMGEMAKWAAIGGDRVTARRAARSALRYAPAVRSLLLNVLAWSPQWLAQRLAARSARQQS
jgi:glycosyltransferase involved in cell wall biosynthesis